MTESTIIINISETKIDQEKLHSHSMLFGKSLTLSQKTINRMEESLKKIISDDIGKLVENLKVVVY